MTRPTFPAVAAILALAAIPAAILPRMATAQAACGARQQVVDHLRTRYGETLRGMGLSADNRIIEVYASEETGTWTITVTSVSGITCLIASGEHFETMARAPVGEAL
ncbi:hypothetical protein N8I71_00180 [Roseibacterium sp. SDUM158016]|jgi:hypothetical protein|uniref:hypothetical protein n=1 Tax=Roseicyclus sediminis TaxID=2980997 RepID=UPI0021D02CED|nr:hypothetical protein [Roseibacterium sp. SDUM158016]MCU4651230.1 hypothetical protein [Roseibacterium sp. SDUM158016]